MKVAFPVVKKLPVLFSGKISTKKTQVKGVRVLKLLKLEVKKYFFVNDV